MIAATTAHNMGKQSGEIISESGKAGWQQSLAAISTQKPPDRRRALESERQRKGIKNIV